MLAAKHIALGTARGLRLLAPVLLLCLVLFSALFPLPLHAQEQDPALFRNELEVVRLINLERRKVGLAPLAWNAELTLAARGFAYDTVENRSAPYCGHVDSLGRSASERMAAAGYLQRDMTAENSLCGYLAAAGAVRGWMNSAPHRANILNADLREVGVGYYRSAKGSYVVLDLALDRLYAPLLINDEAPTTSDPQVSLHLYDQDAGDDWQGVGTTVAMMVANTADFAGAQWEPYAAERNWALLPGEGWRTVYVKTRDRLGRTTIVHDSIYLGSAIPDAELALRYATQVETGFTLDPLDAAGYSHIQFSLNWLADDSDANFEPLSGGGERINDAAAVGGNTFRLGRSGASARNWAASPLGKSAGVAYFRLKLAAAGTGETAVLSVGDGSRQVAARTVRAAEWTAPGQYQEFAVPFTPSGAANGLLVLTVTQRGTTAVDWDAATIYTPPQPAVSPLLFAAPGGYYRSSGVQARLLTPGADGAIVDFSAALEVHPHRGVLAASPQPSGPAVQASPAALAFSTPTADGGALNAVVMLACPGCGDGFTWVVESNVPWLSAVVVNGVLQVQVDPSALGAGVYTGTITLSVAGRADIAPLVLPVTLLIGQLEVLLPNNLYIPLALRR